MLRLGINGFGRIGRLVARIAMQRKDVQLVAVNDIGDLETSSHLFRFDSVHGIWPHPVETENDTLTTLDNQVRFFSERDPAQIPWDKAGIDIVIEATGKFNNKKQASAHLQNGVRKVLISAPGKDVDFTMVMGVNQDRYEPIRHQILSNASCTTNCLAPIAKVINNEFGIVKGLMTTVHSYTNDQRILDLEHKDLRRARAAAQSIIPTTTGAASALGLVIPELNGKLDGMALRVPTPNVSLVDLVVELARPAGIEAVNQRLLQASRNEMSGIIEYCDLPLVSKDFNGNPHSAVVDSLSTMAVGDNMVKIVAWYDNEWGYSNRVVDAVCYLAAQGL